MIDWDETPDGSTVWLLGGTPLVVEGRDEEKATLRYADGTPVLYYGGTGFSKGDPQILYTSPKEAIAASDWHPGDYVYIPGRNAPFPGIDSPPQRLVFRRFLPHLIFGEVTKLAMEFDSCSGISVLALYFKRGDGKATLLANFWEETVPVYYSHEDAFEAEYRLLMKRVGDLEDTLNRVATGIRDVLSAEGLGD